MTSTWSVRDTGSTAEADAETLPSVLARWARTRGADRAFTFVDYRDDPAGAPVSLTWRELDDRVSAVAQWCQRHACPGERIAVLVEQSLDYVIAFLGVLRAGSVAVPMYEPSPLPGHLTRLATALADAAPSVVLTTRRHTDAVHDFLDEHDLDAHLVAVDVLPHRPGEEFRPPALSPDDLAYLQYTSGSTRNPAGVMISHGNVAVAAAQTVRVYEGTPGSEVVSWLPLFHDMGLIVGLAAPLMGGLSSTLLDPLAFLTRPVRWLELMAEAGRAITVAPNFAYGYTASRTTDEDKAGLRLDDVATFGDGSEPVVESTVDTFYARFADCGARRSMFRQGYGLAEAVLLVSSSPAGEPPKPRTFDRELLAAGRAVEVASGSTLVSAGQPVEQRVRVVDPDSHRVLPDGRVGEIWTSGPNVCRGYWGRPEAESAAVFRAVARDADGREVEPYPGCRGWLRTGDLGVLVDGDLFVTGRLKDLIIVDGRNHYPQDVEHTAENAHPAVRRHAVVAFAVSDETGEHAVVVAERARQVPPAELDRAEVAAAVREAVAAEHGLAVRDVVLIEPGELPRTSSGKVRRTTCRAAYLDGALVTAA
ncbi:fatty acyl-AMP ligase [Saccharopolyspora hirsuta]|uniref:Fatty acyl-AMP ligase n=1 Tax=Saccharopolyspora hirsuta TaxID=1837 RepID=A0A5M7BE03_SACHI|nr:fatty acyl-AMP ligase [Saccharopolyspora hirsuta]KAA5827130.1 fatty acyl-AMP ligase [Saccharopolyspora hirsuta]